ncbi:hypothetical protein D3C80_1719620 [compost metagenome]
MMSNGCSGVGTHGQWNSREGSTRRECRRCVAWTNRFIAILHFGLSHLEALSVATVTDHAIFANLSHIWIQLLIISGIARVLVCMFALFRTADTS